jgi:hypothetical protein
MKHAGPAALDALADLIVSLRERSELKEPRPGVFYRKGKAFLHPKLMSERPSWRLSSGAYDAG